MVNNSTNINKTNSHLSPQITEPKKKRPQQMALEIKVLGFGQAQKCGMVKPINGILTFPILIIGSAMAM